MTILSIDREIWKDVPSYEGRYQVSNLGQVRSVTRRITQMGRGGKPFTRTCPGRILRPGRYCKAGHVSVVLGRGTNGRPVHQLVMLTFVGPPPEGLEIRHINGNSEDNRLDNLIYGTRTDNILDVFRQGKPWRKLTAQQALEIKTALSRGETGASISKIYGVSQHIVSSIKTGRTFKWLTS